MTLVVAITGRRAVHLVADTMVSSNASPPPQHISNTGRMIGGTSFSFATTALKLAIITPRLAVGYAGDYLAGRECFRMLTDVARHGMLDTPQGVTDFLMGPVTNSLTSYFELGMVFREDSQILKGRFNLGGAAG